MRNNNSDAYKIIRNFLMFIFILSCIALLITGTEHAGDSALYQLEGVRYERVTADSIKNSCISLWNMLK